MAKKRMARATVPKKPEKPNKPAAPKQAAKPGRKAVTFTLDAPHATQVFIAGSFNDWSPMVAPLERNEAGLWFCTLGLDSGEHQYRFVVDGVWSDDPESTTRRWNEFGTQNCVLIVEE